ncbi:MAG: IS66 family transposase [Planctomycetota bacterium]|nr:IS66 family transposase [Planctomycetota bacterium]
MPPAEQLYAENLSLKSVVAGLHEEIARLKVQLDWLKQRLFGPGRGETLDRAQLLLQLEGLEKLAARLATPPQIVTYERTAAAPAERTTPAEHFAKLPVKETITIEPEEVKAAPAAYERIGEEKTFEIDIVPPQLFKREIVRPKYRKIEDKSVPPVVAPAPAKAVAGGYASAGLLAFIMVSKYVDHQPLYRLEKQSARWGARLSRQTMMEWVAQGATWCEIIYRQMRAALIAGDYLQADETPVRCQDPDVPGKTAQGWLWVISRPGADVIFDWRMSRRHEEASSLLHGFQGRLQSDGYEAYAAFVKTHPGVVHLGCWTHARRYFHDALEEAPTRAGFVLRLIAHLYHLEQTWDTAGLTGPALRAHLRRSEFGLTLKLLKRTAKHLLGLVRPKSQLGEACTYLLNHWDVLVAHCDHGCSRLDNNLVKNAIRPSALGKKNWLFIGHPDAGQRSAIIYSIVVSCQRHGINPLAYLKDVLTRLPAMTNQDDIAALTPAKWKPVTLVS